MSAGGALLRAATVASAAATALVVLGPRSVVVEGRGAVAGWLMFHPHAGALVAALGGLEAAGNLLLFVPVAVLLAAAVPFRGLPPVLVLLVCAPVAVEWAQRSLPGRVPDGADLVRNTIGLLAGFLAVALVRGVGRLLVRQPGPARPATSGSG